MNKLKENLPIIVVASVVVLMIAVVVQSIFLFRLNEQVKRENESRLVVDSVAFVDSGPADDGDNSSPSPKPTIGTSDPSTSLLSDSFFSDIGTDWNPFEEMERMRSEMNQMFGESFGRFSQMPGFDRDLMFGSTFTPDIDLEESDGNYVAKLDIPGVDETKLDVEIKDNKLTIRGEREEHLEEKEGDRILRSERRRGAFERSLMLPGPIEKSKMDVDYEDGVLKVTIPKADS